jgi:hypothetical protein
VKKPKGDIFVRRGHGSPAPVTTVAPILKLASTPWTKDFTPINAETLAAGLRRTPANLRPAAKKAVERLRAKKLPDTPEDTDVEAVYATMIKPSRVKTPPSEALGSFWARRGVTFALDVAARTCGLVIDTADDAAFVVAWSSSNGLFSAYFVAMSGDPIPLEPWKGLRFVLAAADDDAYAEARARAAEHRRKLHPAYRCMVSFAFPTERAWAKEDATEALKHPKLPKYASPLLATELDPTTAKRLAEALPDEHYVVSFLPTAVDIHGAGARGVLAPLLATKPRGKDDRRALVAALDV